MGRLRPTFTRACLSASLLGKNRPIILWRKGFGYFFFACGGVWACCIICSVKRILLAMGITKESAKALGSMTLLAFFPVIQNIAMIAFCIVWFIYMLYLCTSGKTYLKKEEANSCDLYCFANSNEPCCDDFSCDFNGDSFVGECDAAALAIHMRRHELISTPSLPPLPLGNRLLRL